jgi:hypothetical protein
MFHKFALASDDSAGQATSFTVGGTEDAEYPAENLVASSNTGHLNLPSRPAKIEEDTGYWELGFSSPISIMAAAIIYHNFDEGLDVDLVINGTTTVPVTIPAPFVDGWTKSPWVEFSPISASTVRLAVNGTNSLPLQVGRLMLLAAIREIENDVRWGVVETEHYQFISHRTQFLVETVYDMGGKERAINGEVALTNDVAGDFISIFQRAKNRIQPWLLIPDADADDPDAWLVRAEDPFWSRTRETINHNIFPFRVREVSRGLPFP